MSRALVDVFGLRPAGEEERPPHRALPACVVCRERYAPGRVWVDPDETLGIALLTGRPGGGSRPVPHLPVRLRGCGFHWWAAPWVASVVDALEPLWVRETANGSVLSVRYALLFARELRPGRARDAFLTLARVSPAAAAMQVREKHAAGGLRPVFEELAARAARGEFTEPVL